MVEIAISLQPKDAPALQKVSRVLRRSPAKLLGRDGELAVLPKPLHLLLKDIVERLADGRSLVLLPQEKQLTTQQAGELLGVSRPYVIRLLDAGKIRYSLVGKHRRIALSDVLNFAKRTASARRLALDRMAREAHKAGLCDGQAIPRGGRDK